MMRKKVRLNNHSEIEAGLAGDPNNKTIMLPIAKKSVTGEEAEMLKQWGVDPEWGERFVEGLSGQFQVLYFDYEGHLFQHPEPDRLTVDYIVRDLLLIADEMGIRSYSYYGYSWLGLIGLQLALKTDRLESLIMGGFPPYEGPYEEMLIVTEKTYGLAEMFHAGHAASKPFQSPEEADWDDMEVSMDPRTAKQFLTLYRSLGGFDDRLIQGELKIPRLAFTGEEDTIVYGERFGNVTVDMAGLMKKNRTSLEMLGWNIEILQGKGMDHTKAMQSATVLPLIKPWLMRNLK